MATVRPISPGHNRERITVSETDKLTWLWISKKDAAKAAALGNCPEMEALRKGQGLLSNDQFTSALAAGDMEVLMTSAGFALVAWGEAEEGKAMNILTVVTSMFSANLGIKEVEQAALQRGAKIIITIGRPGWKRVMIDHGYTVTDAVIIRKVIA